MSTIEYLITLIVLCGLMLGCIWDGLMTGKEIGYKQGQEDAKKGIDKYNKKNISDELRTRI